jgi:phosphate uptake regulator
MGHQQLSLLIEECRYSRDVDTQIDLLREINSHLPDHDRLEMPSLITDDYCRRALEIIEDRIVKVAKASGREFSWP